MGLTQKPVEIVEKDVKIDNIKYSGTPGLYKLLFKKEPKGYTKTDLDNYMDILSRTNAYRRNFDPNEQVQGNASPKYITIIGPYLQKQGITKSKIANPAALNLVANFQRRKAPYRIAKSKGSGLTLKVNTKIQIMCIGMF